MRRTGRDQKHGPTWRYQADVHAEGEPRRREWKGGFRTKADAQAALNDRLREVRLGATVTRSNQTVAEWLNHLLIGRQLAGLRATTVDSYRRNLTRHVSPVIGDRRIQTVRAPHINALYRGMLEGLDGRKPVGARTTRYTHTVLRRAFEDARRDGLIMVNPTDDATPPSTTAARAPEMTAWTPSELRALLTAVAESDHWPLLWVAAFTGMRRSELCGLRWVDVDHDGHALTVRQTLTTVDHKPVVADVKTRRSRRRLDVDDETVAVLPPEGPPGRGRTLDGSRMAERDGPGVHHG